MHVEVALEKFAEMPSRLSTVPTSQEQNHHFDVRHFDRDQVGRGANALKIGFGCWLDLIALAPSTKCFLQNRRLTVCSALKQVE
jgi:hypothetical protein